MNKETKLAIVIDAKNNAEKTLNSVSGSLKGIQDSNESLISSSKQVGAVAGVAFAGLSTFIGFAVKSASEADVTMRKVDATLKTMGKSADGARKVIDQFAQSALKLGFDDEEASLAVTKLFQVTGDLTKAQQYSTIAMDLARAKNISLSDASRMVTLVLSGNARALKEYGITIDETKTPLEGLMQLQGMVAGQADTFASSFAGQGQVLKETWGNLTETIGATFLPMLTQLLQTITPLIQSVTEWTAKHPELVKYLLLAGLAVTGLVAGVTLLIPLLIALNLPMIGITLTIVALIAGIVWVGVVFWKLGQQWDYVVVGMKLAIKELANFVIIIFNNILLGITDTINSAIATINKLIIAISKVPLIGKALKGKSISLISAPQVQELETKSLYDKLASPDLSNKPNVVITGNTFLDENSAEKIGDLIMKKLGMSNAF